jgi:integrase
MTHKGRGGDGVEYVGPIAGRKYFNVRITYDCPKTGKRKDTTRKIQADSKALAIMARAKLLEELTNPDLSKATQTLSFRDVAEAWLETITTHGTKMSWGSHMRFLVKEFGDTLIDRISTLELQAYLGRCTHLSVGSLRMRKQVLKRIYAYALDKGYLAVDPTERLRPMPRPRSKDDAVDPPKRALTAKELNGLFQYLKSKEPAYYPLARTQLFGGMRFSEVSALHPDDVNLATGIVSIRRGQYFGRKGTTKGKYARTVALDPETIEVIKEHRETVTREQWQGYETILFPRPPSGRRRGYDHWSLNTACHVMQRAWAALKLPVEGSTHVLRRSAVDLIREHVSQPLLQLLLGHKDPELSKLYSSASAEDAIKAAESMRAALMEHGPENGN